MDAYSYLRFLGALLVVLGLLALFAFALRKWRHLIPSLGQNISPRAPRRLVVVDNFSVSPRHRLILVRRDEIEHLLLIGPDTAIVVETGIGA